MKQFNVYGIIVITALSLLLGCTTPQPSQDLLAPTEAQMKIRSVQTRAFDVKDRQVAMRAVIATLQDLGFIIERANEHLGLVTAARFAEPNFYDVVGVTVTVRPETDGRMTIRATLTAAFPEARRISNFLERDYGDAGVAVSLEERPDVAPRRRAELPERLELILDLLALVVDLMPGPHRLLDVLSQVGRIDHRPLR